MEKTAEEKTKEILSFSWEKDYQKIEEIYRELLASDKHESYQILLLLLSSNDLLHIMKAAEVLAAKGNPRYLPEIKEIRRSLPGHKGLQDYRSTVDRCIDILENIQRNAPCRCPLYESLGSGFSGTYIPDQEKKDGSLEIVKEELNKEKYVYEFFCRCTTCGRRWKVTKDIGYHYPTFSWEEITDCDEYRAIFSSTPL